MSGVLQFADRTSAEVVQLALAERDDEPLRWDLVRELHRRGTEEEFALACKLLDGAERDQSLGCDILGQLGYGRRHLGVHPFASRSAPLIGRALRSSSPDVQQAAVIAAGHLDLKALFDEVIELAQSADPGVRNAVACALGGRVDDASVNTLIVLSRDPDDEVRNWATFGLGTQCERSDPFICDALARSLADPHSETRGEAWAGLASKGDLRAFDAVLQSLSGDTLDVLAIEAAAAYRRHELLPALERWRDRCGGPDDSYFMSLLENAIEACRPDRRG